MRRRRCLLCPLALWIRKVLLRLSDGVSNIDLNSLTRLIPDGSTFSPQPLNSSSHCIVLALRSQWNWKPAQPAHRVALCPNKLNRRKGRREQRKKKGAMSRQFNYPTRLSEALRNSRLDLVSLIPTCQKQVPDLHRLTRRGRTGEEPGLTLCPGSYWEEWVYVQRVHIKITVSVKSLDIWIICYVHIFKIHLIT